MSKVWRQDRPKLVIESKGGANLGRCYNAQYFEVTSTTALCREDLYKLREMGFLGYGQEFHVTGPFSSEPGVPEPTGVDVVQCVDTETGEAPAVNPYSGKPYPDHEFPYYVYKCESRVDSSD